jgi:hypothetical protein
MKSIKVVLLTLCVLFTFGVNSVLAQDKKDQPKLSGDEQKAAKKIEEAKDTATKFQTVSEFLAKFPKSSLRPKLASFLAAEVSNLTDMNQKVSYGEQFFSIFTEKSETDLVSPYLVEAYLNTKKLDEAFQVGEDYLSRHADDVVVLSQLASYGASQAQQGNGKHIKQSMQFANTAIGLIESNKKPSSMTDEKWTNIKKATLPSLYQGLGVMSMQSSKRDEAKSKFAKAAELNSVDPLNHYMLGVIAEEEYKETAKAYNASLPGKQKDDLLAKANSQLDVVIDYYARALGAADGNPAYQNFSTQLRQDIETYYKYRHNNSLNGLQELINKYKPMKLQ